LYKRKPKVHKKRMRYKDGVYTKVLAIKKGKEVLIKQSPEIKAAKLAANALHKEITGKEIVITAILDGKHMKGSRHYSGNAFDMRKWYLKKEQLNKFINALKISLGKDYDVVNETTHIHIEYDPKNKIR